MLYLDTRLPQYTLQEIDAMLAQLPQWRRKAAQRFKYTQGRMECAAAYLMLCKGLRDEYGIDEKPAFQILPNGKPVLRDFAEIHFSLSHCIPAAGCLLYNKPCGLDIERLRPADKDLVRYTMNESESESIFSAQDPDLAFTTLWTKKEAVAKLRGTGITSDLHNILHPERIADLVIETMVHEKFVVSTAIMKE